ncbi:MULTISPECIES: sugar kinase [unclassified Duganella]|uniref:sugar kinase n=1 Tax=unclassified Duganella TaxID=2636909 RepID=UPI0006F93CDD|nr:MULTISPECIES: sugar kinase [unclassified Duganella]KQV61477.1 2-keto-3-deoxygluconate kinase [Duganella sp. Root336D2]KRB92433.1 2-keto-3-deoxygluconate kinase [Duganella sp. Root198D2]
MENDIVCFGELLLRLSAPGGQVMLQSPHLDTCIGGAEANVAVSLARLGHRAALVSSLPDNALGQSIRDGVRAHGVDTRAIRFAPGRVGLYFLTSGAVLRPAEIIYDRECSVFAATEPAAYHWPALLEGAGWLHVSGISAATGERGAQTTLDAMRAARALGVKVSFDGNYRAALWARRGSDGADVLCELMRHADLAFADQRDFALVLRRPGLGQGSRTEAMAAAFAAFPHLASIAATSRSQLANERHDLSATLCTRSGSIQARTYEMHGIVDRIGTGDAFAAGILHGLLHGWDDDRTLGFGLAAAVAKHSIAGDFNLANEAQIDAVSNCALDVRR